MWIDSLKLDIDRLLSPCGWLTDRLINAAQKLLRKQFHEVYGLQDVELGIIMSFVIQEGNFIQILHSPPNHWVTISVSNGKVKHFDSRYNGLAMMLQAQISCLLSPGQNHILIDVMDVQTQVNPCSIYIHPF